MLLYGHDKRCTCRTSGTSVDCCVVQRCSAWVTSRYFTSSHLLFLLLLFKRITLISWFAHCVYVPGMILYQARRPVFVQGARRTWLHDMNNIMTVVMGVSAPFKKKVGFLTRLGTAARKQVLTLICMKHSGGIWSRQNSIGCRKSTVRTLLERSKS